MLRNNIIRSKVRALRMLLCAILIVFGTIIPSPTHEASAASCYGAGCKGYNPETMGCGADARTMLWVAIVGGRAENRASVTCNAEWEQTKNESGASKYAAGSIRYGCADFCLSYNISSPAKIGNGQTVYTAMVGPDSQIDTRSCGKLSNTGPIGTPLPINNNCTGVH